MCEARRSTRHRVASGDTRIGHMIPPSMSKPCGTTVSLPIVCRYGLGKGEFHPRPDPWKTPASGSNLEVRQQQEDGTC